MFEKLRTAMLRKRSESEQSNAAAYSKLVAEAVANRLGDSTKDLAHVESVLAKCGVSFGRFSEDVEHERRRSELEGVASNQAAIEAEIQSIKSEIRDNVIARDKCVADFNSKLAELETQRHQLLTRLGDAGRAAQNLQDEFPDSPIAEALPATQAIEVLKTRIRQLDTKLAEAVAAVDARRYAVESNSFGGTALEHRRQDDLAKSELAVESLTAEIESARAELESARKRVDELVWV